MMNRIADATGTPLDAMSVDATADLRRDLGLDSFETKRMPTS